MANKNVSDDTVCLLTFGLYNNTTVKKLDLSCNNITKNGAIAISNCLKHNSTLQALNISHNCFTDNEAVIICDCLKMHNSTLQNLDFSHNNISDKGAADIGKCLKHNKTIKALNLSENCINIGGITVLSKCIKYTEYIDFSGNISPSWDGYIEIIKRGCVNNLTLCGDEGMIRYAKEVVCSLKVNAVLQSLTLCVSRNSVGRYNYKDMVAKVNSTKSNILVIDGNLCSSALADSAEEAADKVVSIRILYDAYDNCEHLHDAICLSKNKVNDDTVCSIAFGLYHNTTVTKLDLSYNNITDNGAIIISDILKHNSSVQKLDVSHNNIANDGAKAIGYSLKITKL